jgi:hypothetical protein
MRRPLVKMETSAAKMSGDAIKTRTRDSMILELVTCSRQIIQPQAASKKVYCQRAVDELNLHLSELAYEPRRLGKLLPISTVYRGALVFSGNR